MPSIEATESAESHGRPDDITAVPVRRPGRWIATVLVLLVALAIVNSVASNPRFQWGLVGHYLFDPRILRGVRITIELTVVAMAMGVVGGVGLAVMRLSPNRLVSGASWLYIWFLRGTPLLVQFIFWNSLGELYPSIAVGIPFGPAFFHIDANSVLKPFVVCILALGLNEAAYMAEIVRAGIISVDKGQYEAAGSLGMGRLMTMRRIVLPQAMRVIVPPTGNEAISMLKNTSLASVIAYTELLYSVQLIYSVNYKIIPLLIVASFWYLVMTSVMYVGQYFIERRFGRGFSRAEQVSMRARWLAFGHGQ
ncbi:MAG: amino acid ABC transporter permease [Actinomycetota bacterium]|nr:amino acid ABC transporter permease [Actinomycetota bacterium]